MSYVLCLMSDVCMLSSYPALKIFLVSKHDQKWCRNYRYRCRYQDQLSLPWRVSGEVLMLMGESDQSVAPLVEQANLVRPFVPKGVPLQACSVPSRFLLLSYCRGRYWTNCVASLGVAVAIAVAIAVVGVVVVVMLMLSWSWTCWSLMPVRSGGC